MKKLLITFLFLFLVNTVFSQEISGPKPRLSYKNPETGEWVSFNHITLPLGCGVQGREIKAEWTAVKSPDRYRMESIPFKPKGYLRPTSSTTVMDPVVGQKITLDDDGYGPVQFPVSNGVDFDFCFFGNQRHEFVISSNGVLSFDTSLAGEHSDYTIDSPTSRKIAPTADCGTDPNEFKDAIMQYHDTDPTGSGHDFDSYFFWDVLGNVGERYLIMGTHKLPMYRCGGDYGLATHQMVYYETTNIIEYHILNKPICFDPAVPIGPDSWVHGYMAMGLQNADRTIGFAAPGRDNLDHFQILESTVDTDGDLIPDEPEFYNDNFPILPPESWRFIPDGDLGTEPVFVGWHINWVDENDRGTVISTDTILNFEGSQIPVPPGTITVTAVLEYEEYCSGEHYFATQDVTFDIDDPITGHIKEKSSTDDDVEFLFTEEIELCEGEDYSLEMLLQNYDSTDGIPFDVKWTVSYFGNPDPTAVISTDLNYDIITANLPLDDATTYTYTCSVTHGSCPFPDSIKVRVNKNDATMHYLKDEFCVSEGTATPDYPNVSPNPDPTTIPNEEYFYTITNSGVWANPLASNPTKSLDGIVDLAASIAGATATGTLNADGSADFDITYHAHCPDNLATDTIKIRNAPMVVDPVTGDPTATPLIEPCPLITECETNTNLHKADFIIRGYTDSTTGDYIPGIEDYIANGTPLADLNFVWESQTGGITFDDPMPASYNSTTVSVKLTVSTNNPAACEIVFLFDLTVGVIPTANNPSTNYLTVCEIPSGNGIGRFSGDIIQEGILGTSTPPANIAVTYVGTGTAEDGTTIDISNTLPASGNFDVPSMTVTATVTNTDTNCSKDVVFNLEVRDTPTITAITDSTTTPLIICETDTTNHTAVFDTTGWFDAALVNNTTTTDFTVDFTYEDTSGVIITETLPSATATTGQLPNNLTLYTQTITIRAYNLDPAKNCTSEETQFNVVVNPLPQEIGTPRVTICSGESLNIDLDNYTTLSGNTYTWTAIDITGVSGITTSGTGNITDTLTNTTSDPKTVNYKVIPKSTDGCVGNTYTIEATVRPESVVAALPTTDITLCETDFTFHTANFDTTGWENTILGATQPTANYYINYTAFEVADDGTETPYSLPDPLPSSLIAPDLKIGVTVNYDIDGTTTCNSTTTYFYLEVIEKPTATALVNTVSDPATSTDIPLILCETDTTSHTAEFNTTNWNSTILGTSQTTGFEVVYRAVSVDPLTLVETPYSLPSPFPEATNMSTLPSLKIYTKVIYEIDASTQCESNEVFFFIESNESPSIKVPYDIVLTDGKKVLEECESDTSTDPDVHKATFDTSNWITTILDGQTGANYHVVLTAINLNGDVVTLPNPLPVNFETESLIITALVTDDNLPCNSVEKEFVLDVKIVPINNDIPDITQCEDDNDPDITVHTSTFNTSDWTSTVIGTQDSTNLIVEYSYLLEDGTSTTVIDTGDLTTTTLPLNIISSSQTVSVVIKNQTSSISCANPVTETFDLIVIETPTYVAQNDITKCENDTNSDPDVHEFGFDTTAWNTAILGTQVAPEYSVIYSAFTIDPVTNNEIPYTLDDPLPAILNVPSITIRYAVRYTIDATNNIYCDSAPPTSNPNENTFKLNVRLIPFISQLEDDTNTTGLVDLQICDDDGDSSTFTASFDTTNWNKVILANNYDNTVSPPYVDPDFIIEYTYEDINGNSQTVTSSNLPNPFVLTSQTIKYSVKNRTTGEDTCPSEEKEFEVIVNELPIGTDPLPVICSGEKVHVFDTSGDPIDLLLDKTATFDNNGDDISYNTYKWYADDENDVTGETLIGNQVITDDGDPIITDILTNTSTTVQFVTYHVTPISADGCEGDPYTITVEVGFAPEITDKDKTFCNKENFSIDLNDFTTLTGNTYLWSAIENDNVEGETTTTMTTSNITDTIINTSGNPQIIDYVVIPSSSGKCEGDSFVVHVTINPQPEFELKPQYSICPDIGSVTIGEDSNPDETTYEYRWYYPNVSAAIGYHKLYEVDVDEINTHGNTLILKVTDLNTGCTHTQVTSINMAEQVIITNIYVSDFNRPDNTITIEVSGGTGTYEYTLHHTDYNGTPQSITQSSPVFEHLDAATYYVEITDLSGCSVSAISDDIYVLDYPPFFTPNGDLQNDTWQISGANIIPNSRILIFDRYGKVITSISPNSIGWDGLYNGIQVPATDYWFTAEYRDPNTGKAKTVKGHFSIVIN